MIIADFAENIDKDKDLSISSFDNKKDCFVVNNSKLKESYECSFKAVCKQKWVDLARVLHGGEVEVLKKMSRIVGYFSQIKNWNKGKIGELADRHGGDYGI